jgi:hypothetical protein
MNSPLGAKAAKSTCVDLAATLRRRALLSAQAHIVAAGPIEAT